MESNCFALDFSSDSLTASISLKACISVSNFELRIESFLANSFFSYSAASCNLFLSISSNCVSRSLRSSSRLCVISSLYVSISSRQLDDSEALLCSRSSIFSAMFFNIICSADLWSLRSLKLAVMIVSLSPRSLSNFDAAIVSCLIFSINSGAAPS